MAGTALAVAVLAVGIVPATAAGIVRDAETEALIQDYARPIFKAAGIRATGVKILVVNDDSFNAFVSSADRMFVNTGAIIRAETPNELIGVIAHETGHLAHGDLGSIRQRVQSTQNSVLAAALIGFGVAIAGAASGVKGLGDLGQGIAAASMQIGQRSILAYVRGQEAAADRSAMDFLVKTGQSGNGLLNMMKRLSSESLVSARSVDPYTQTHPMPAERVRSLEALAAADKFANVKDSAALKRRHDLVRAKLIGFTWSPERVNREYPMTDNSLPAKYARAIALYRRGSLVNVVKAVDGLIAADPSDAYFYELKGQALLEGGKPNEALAPLKRAVELAPRASLIRILYGQALVAVGGAANMDAAIEVLNAALQTDHDMPVGYRALARAYASKSDIAMAELATAEGLFVDGDFPEARTHAKRAQVKLKAGSPGWLRAEDIVSYKPPIVRQ
ncbi:MAG TPA: M48 family metalloprotease [Bauldia sp.]|nr:M48 family metalloprotease [Bauldia sp.]